MIIRILYAPKHPELAAIKQATTIATGSIAVKTDETG